MDENNYSIANLNQEELGEIKRYEQQLSEKLGHPIALIAYDRDEQVKD